MCTFHTRLIAEEMVRMMAIDPDKLNLSPEARKVKLSREPCLFPKSWKFLDLVPETFPDPDKNARFASTSILSGLLL